MFLLPFVTMSHHQPIPSFLPEWIAAVLGLAALIPFMYANTLQNINIPMISQVFAGLSAILGLQWMFGLLHSTQYALLVLSYLGWALLLTILGNHLRKELGWEKLASTLAWSTVVAGIINTVIVLLQLVIRTGGAVPFLPNLPDYGAISQHNHFAVFTILSITSLIYLFSKNRFSVSFFTLMLTCFLLMLSFSGSRSSWLFLFALAALTVFMHRSHVKRHADTSITKKLMYITLLLLPAFVLIQTLLQYLLPGELVSLPTARLVQNLGTSSTRLGEWYDSLRLFLQSPWLGNGAGSMRAQSLMLFDYPASMAARHVFENAHNLFLNLLAEMGIGGFLIVFISLIGWLRAFEWQKLNQDTWWAAGILGTIGVHSMVEFPLWYAYFLGITAFLLGAGDERSAYSSPRHTTDNFKYKSRNLLKQLLAITILLVGTVNLGSMLIANLKLEHWADQWLQDDDMSQQKKELDWVQQYSLLSPYAGMMRVLSMEVSQDKINDKVALSQSSLRFIPLRRIAYQHALLLELQGDHTGAVKQLKRTLQAYPGKIEDVLETLPAQYRQKYLELLTEADPVLFSQVNIKQPAI